MRFRENWPQRRLFWVLAVFSTGAKNAKPRVARGSEAPRNRGKPVWKFGSGGERGIRTLDTRLTYTHFPGVRLQPLGHLSSKRQILLQLTPLVSNHLYHGRNSYMVTIDRLEKPILRTTNGARQRPSIIDQAQWPCLSNPAIPA